jgi:hypothetical protein
MLQDLVANKAFLVQTPALPSSTSSIRIEVHLPAVTHNVAATPPSTASMPSVKQHAVPSSASSIAVTQLLSSKPSFTTKTTASLSPIIMHHDTVTLPSEPAFKTSTTQSTTRQKNNKRTSSQASSSETVAARAQPVDHGVHTSTSTPAEILNSSLLALAATRKDMEHYHSTLAPHIALCKRFLSSTTDMATGTTNKLFCFQNDTATGSRTHSDTEINATNAVNQRILTFHNFDLIISTVIYMLVDK